MKIKTEKHIHEPSLSMDGFIVTNRGVDLIIGRVLTFIESLGLPERQESATKDLLKQIIRNGVDEHRNSFCAGQLVGAVMEINSLIHDECIKNPVKEAIGKCPRDGLYEITFTSHDELN